MQTHIGRGIGKHIEEELFNAKDYVKICSPNISYSLCKRLFDLLDNDVKIRVITSDVITGDKNSNQANSLAKDTIKKFQDENNSVGNAVHIINSSTVVIESGFHPCVVAPGYEMYYFTILGGLSQRSLVQYFQPDHAYQLETIPGIKDMIAKYK